jgi:hypothetical protein
MSLDIKLLRYIINDIENIQYSKIDVLTLFNTVLLKQSINKSIQEYTKDTDVDNLIDDITNLSIDDIKIEDIEKFYNINTRSNNDVSNKIREKILLKLFNIGKFYTNDINYSSKWLELKDAWNSVLKEIANNVRYDNIEVTNLGGRGNNSDYLVKYYNNNELILSKNVEFKFNASDISKIPQILQIYEASLKLPVSYSEYYYDNFLKKYLDTDNELRNINIPDKEIYLKYIKNTKYDCHELFTKMYNHEETEKSLKFNIVNESIKSYLEKYGKDCNIEVFKSYLNKSQLDKVYILWDIKQKKFHIDQCLYNSSKELILSEVTDNTIIIKQDDIIFKLLLRWKNHKGILLPAYQISYKIIDKPLLDKYYYIDKVFEYISNSKIEVNLLKNKDVIQWLFEDMSFLPEIEKINKTKDNSKYKILEDRWGQNIMKELRPDLKLDKQWTNLFGEYICKEVYLLMNKIINKPTKKLNYQPDLEMDDSIIEVKTGTYYTSGTAGEKILGCAFKYAEIPNLYSKNLKIICIGGAEKMSREQYGNLKGDKCSTEKIEILDFLKKKRIEYVGITDILKSFIHD